MGAALTKSDFAAAPQPSSGTELPFPSNARATAQLHAQLASLRNERNTAATHPSPPSIRRRWIEWLSVAGACAQGAVYVAIGGIAIRAAANLHAKPQGMSGALKTLATSPMGSAVLALVAAGFAAIALSRVLEIIFGKESTSQPSRSAVRVWNILIAAMYVGLSILALHFLVHPQAPPGNEGMEYVGFAMAQPFGRWLIAALGLMTAIIGIHQLITAVRRSDCPAWMRWCGGFGDASFGLLFILIGSFLVSAAMRRAPGEARGISGTLTYLQQHPSGALLVAAIGLGLLVYGIMSPIEAFRKPSSQVNIAV